MPYVGKHAIKIDVKDIYITKVETNIKDLGSEFTFTNSKIFLAGKNGTGKTALINAIQLALLGHASDLAGRDTVKAPNFLSNLLPPGAPVLYSTVTFSDGSVASWMLEPGSKPKWKKPPFEVNMPMQETLEAFSGSRAVALRYLMKYFGRKDAGNDFDYEDLFGSYADSLPDTQFNFQVLAIEEKARKAASKYKAVAKACQSTLDSLGPTDARAELMQSIERLISFQLEKESCTCGVCGQSADLTTFKARHDKVLAKLPSSPVADTSIIAGLVAARDDALAHEAKHRAVEDRIMKYLEGWCKVKSSYISATLSDKSPLGPIKIDMTDSYVLIGRDMDGHVMPLVSGAQIIVLAMMMSTVAWSLPGFTLVITPDSSIDTDRMKDLLAQADKVKRANVIVQSIHTPMKKVEGWDNLVLEERE